MSAAASNNNNDGKETFMQTVMRSVRNCCTSTAGVAKKSDEIAKLKYKENRMHARMKEFGVRYMTIKAQNASAEELQRCVDECERDVEALKEEIATLRTEIDRVDQETKGKLIASPNAKKPETPTTSTSAAPATATAATTSTDPLPPPETAVGSPPNDVDPQPETEGEWTK